MEKDYHGKRISNQPVKNNLRICDNIQKIATNQGDDYTTSYLLDYNYFNKYYKMVAIDLNKQEALDADSKVIQPITARDPNANTTISFITEETKETILDFSQGSVKVL